VVVVGLDGKISLQIVGEIAARVPVIVFPVIVNEYVPLKANDVIIVPRGFSNSILSESSFSGS
jgi:hypothetical protein